MKKLLLALLFFPFLLITESLVALFGDIKIILTASPDMGGSPRLPQPLRFIAGLRSMYLNKAFYRIVEEKNLTIAPIAKKNRISVS